MKIHIKTCDFEINIEDERCYQTLLDFKEMIATIVEQSNKLNQ